MDGELEREAGAGGGPGSSESAERGSSASGERGGSASGERGGSASGERGGGDWLPVMPGFREMAARREADARAARVADGQAARVADAQAARMAEDRGRLVRELAEQRQAAGLSQTEVAARMGTSQSAVARLESGTADVRASTLERYAAAVGGQITWQLSRPGEGTIG